MFTYINSLCNETSSRLLEYPNVVGYGNGFKVIRNIETTIPTLKIFVTKKIPSQYLPENALLPKSYKGVITDVIETGEFRLFSLNSKERPMLGGYCIGVLQLEDAGGTAACLVYDLDDPQIRYILSCNHALARNDVKNLNKTVVQPHQKFQDGRLNKVASVSKFVRIRFGIEAELKYNLADCAIARLVSNQIASPSIMFTGIPKGIQTKPMINQKVKKVGTVSGLTTGIITSTTSVFNIAFPDGTVEKSTYFKNQILTNLMSSHGDSGALLLDQDNKAVGLLIGGNENMDFFSPMPEVLKALNVGLVTKK